MSEFNHDQAEYDVAVWNRDNPPGTPVWLTDDSGKRHETVTRSEAWMLGSGHPVVMVEGRTGGYLLDRIEVRKAERSGSKEAK